MCGDPNHSLTLQSFRCVRTGSEYLVLWWEEQKKRKNHITSLTHAIKYEKFSLLLNHAGLELYSKSPLFFRLPKYNQLRYWWIWRKRTDSWIFSCFCALNHKHLVHRSTFCLIKHCAGTNTQANINAALWLYVKRCSLAVLLKFLSYQWFSSPRHLRNTDHTLHD